MIFLSSGYLAQLAYFWVMLEIHRTVANLQMNQNVQQIIRIEDSISLLMLAEGTSVPSGLAGGGGVLSVAGVASAWRCVQRVCGRGYLALHISWQVDAAVAWPGMLKRICGGLARGQGGQRRRRATRGERGGTWG